jgi:hypothetical protein
MAHDRALLSLLACLLASPAWTAADVRIARELLALCRARRVARGLSPDP